jgi:hypothetical protein
VGIFDIGKDNDEIATPDKAGVKQEQVKQMAGFKDIREVAKAAPSGYGTSNPSDTPSGRRLSSRDKAKQKEEQERQEKLEKRRRAIATLGKRYAKWLAENPYKMWAAFADDDRLKLNPEEAAELSEMYFELAEALEPDLTAWYVIAIGIAAQNSSLVIERLKYINEMEKEEHEKRTTPKLPEKESMPVQ